MHALFCAGTGVGPQGGGFPRGGLPGPRPRFPLGGIPDPDGPGGLPGFDPDGMGGLGDPFDPGMGGLPGLGGMGGLGPHGPGFGGMGGFGGAVLEALADGGVAVPSRVLAAPDALHEHGSSRSSIARTTDWFDARAMSTPPQSARLSMQGIQKASC